MTAPSSLLFTPITIGGVTFRNRIATSPMCMHSATLDGHVATFHHIHYGARALGGAALVMLESTAVQPNGVLGAGDLGIYDDTHVPGLAALVSTIHTGGALAGAQLGHSGRKLELDHHTPVAPSAQAYDTGWRIPHALSTTEITEVVTAFADGARRARQAGFDVLEVHTAHGYLLNEFLSPLSNHRTDSYGGDHAGRYRIVREVLDAVQEHWSGPLFVRVSATDHTDGGNTAEDFLIYGAWMKEQGVHLIDASAGGVVPARVHTYPGFQVPAAQLIREGVGIPTGAVGLITTGRQAEEVLSNARADLVFVGRETLKDPFWARSAADDLREEIEVPAQYTRYGTAWLAAQARPTPAVLEVTVASQPALALEAALHDVATSRPTWQDEENSAAA